MNDAWETTLKLAKEALRVEGLADESVLKKKPNVKSLGGEGERGTHSRGSWLDRCFRKFL
ncbi:hypothetical protein AGMMS49921_01690 [Endomicrobiia bacterium]|nr:hypothetical protein AGMMS49921_01690 [Endomicrobiia bacterium]